MFDGTHMDAGWWVVMTVFWIAFLGVVVWSVMVLGRRGSDPREPRAETPTERLDRRLADGEIDAETYDEISWRLQHDRDAVGTAP